MPGNATLAAAMRTHQAATAAQLPSAGTGVALAPTTALPATFPGALRRLGPLLTRDVLALIANAGDTCHQVVQHRGVTVLAPKDQICTAVGLPEPDSQTRSDIGSMCGPLTRGGHTP